MDYKSLKDFLAAIKRANLRGDHKITLPMDEAVNIQNDIALLLLTGSLKRKEMGSGRFADAICATYEISACLKLYEEKFQNDDKVKSILKLSILKLVKEADTAMLTNIESLPVNRVVKLLLKFLFFPFSVTNAKIDDKLIISSSKLLITNSGGIFDLLILVW